MVIVSIGHFISVGEGYEVFMQRAKAQMAG
jgi:hypothetical protein